MVTAIGEGGVNIAMLFLKGRLSSEFLSGKTSEPSVVSNKTKSAEDKSDAINSESDKTQSKYDLNRDGIVIAEKIQTFGRAQKTVQNSEPQGVDALKTTFEWNLEKYEKAKNYF